MTEPGHPLRDENPLYYPLLKAGFKGLHLKKCDLRGFDFHVKACGY
jgi:hypothetical protein